MDEVEDFETVFSFKSDYAFDHKTVEVILANRRTLENELFFDRLLRVLGIRQAKKLYPPRSNQELRTLHREIISSASADHHKLSLLYYVLKDCIHFSDASERFGERYYIPEKYRTYIQGLWHLDRLKFERALGFLSEPSLIPTFPEEILYTLCVHAAKEDFTLPIAYYHTVAPPLTSVKILDAFFSVLCRSSITEAFYFSRGHSDEVHRHLLEQLVGFVHSGVSGKTRSERGVELVNLPLNEEEEHWFEEYLLSGKGRTLQGSKDTVTMRRIATGKVTEAFQVNAGLNRGQLHGLNWDILKGSLEKGAGPRAIADLEVSRIYGYPKPMRKAKGLIDRCRYDHPSKNLQTQNRFGVFQSPENERTSNRSNGSYGGTSSDRPLPYSLNKDIIINDLSKEHPQWILSAYGPGRDAPLQLFGGLPREQSFEEMRLHHYIAAASGNQTQAILEAQRLVNDAEQQMQTVLRDVDGAINYIIDGAKTHPNRLDICKGQGGSGSGQQSAFGSPSPLGVPQPITSSTFGQPAALGKPTSAFGQPASSFGQPSALGRPQPATFGQPSIPPSQPASAFGQPSGTFGRPSTSFGQPSGVFGQPSLGPATTASSFGQPSALGGTISAPSTLGQPTGFGAAQQPTSSFGQSSNPFGQASAVSPPQTTPFAQPSQPAQLGSFGQPSQPAQPSGFGQASQPAQPSGFGQPSQPAQSTGFGQSSQLPQTGGFGLPAKPPAPTTNGAFGAPPATTNGHSVQRDAQNKLTAWHGKPVSYIDGDPCYRRPDGTWEKIWFPDGPPKENEDTQLPDEAYDERTKEAYMYMREHRAFKDGIMPDKPPKREWCNWDF